MSKFSIEDILDLKRKAFGDRRTCEKLAFDFRAKNSIRVHDEDFDHLLDMIFEAGKSQGRAILAEEITPQE